MLPEILPVESNGLGSQMRRLIEDKRPEWRGLDERITAFDGKLAERAPADDARRISPDGVFAPYRGKRGVRPRGDLKTVPFQAEMVDRTSRFFR
jgi:hypothetical protein